MLYLNESHLNSMGICWETAANTIDEAVSCLATGDYAQPVKPYLRYRDPQNRIIAMPAYVGGAFGIAGIKWIASFPENYQRQLPRAHSVLVLNDADTGVPVAIFNTPLLSIIRTAAVSSWIVKQYLAGFTGTQLKIGIIGWGPIGQQHYHMCKNMVGDKAVSFKVYDLQPEKLSGLSGSNALIVASSWEDAYTDADIFITATVSKKAYINLPPKEGSLHLNVSLRDYMPAVSNYFKGNVIVDNWEEICREGTDIEVMHRDGWLQQAEVHAMPDIRGKWHTLNKETPVFFNPMGMGVFDMAIAGNYYKLALEQGIGIHLANA